MKAITTRYIGPTTHRPARILAADLDGNRVTLPADGDFPYDDVHRAAAVALCAKMGWPGAEGLVGGTIKHARVWVFTHCDTCGGTGRVTADLDGRCDECAGTGRRQPEGAGR